MWWLVCGAAGVLGLLGGLASSPPGSVTALAVTVGALGALVGTGTRLSSDSLPETHLGRAVVRSAGLGAVATLGIVLPFLLIGRGWFAGVLLLGVTSPPAARWCRSRWHGHAPLGGITGVEGELWTAWVMSGRALEHPMSVADATVLIELRQQVLDELSARHGGIPEQLWSGGPLPPASGDRRTGRP